MGKPAFPYIQTLYPRCSFDLFRPPPKPPSPPPRGRQSGELRYLHSCEKSIQWRERLECITEDERIEIYALKKAGFSKLAIARQLKRDPETIRDEIARNTGGCGYRPKQAHAKALKRRRRPRRPTKMTPEDVEFIEDKFREDYSSERISAVMADAGLDPVSHERIYRRIYEDQAAAGVLSITFDNGREFAGHLDVAAALDCRTYFAKPCHSRERGTNENTNGLFRQYFPKGMDLRGVGAEQLELAMNRLNHRPRKVPGFKTPAAVFSGEA